MSFADWLDEKVTFWGGLFSASACGSKGGASDAEEATKAEEEVAEDSSSGA